MLIYVCQVSYFYIDISPFFSPLIDPTTSTIIVYYSFSISPRIMGSFLELAYLGAIAARFHDHESRRDRQPGEGLHPAEAAGGAQSQLHLPPLPHPSLSSPLPSTHLSQSHSWHCRYCLSSADARSSRAAQPINWPCQHCYYRYCC